MSDAAMFLLLSAIFFVLSGATAALLFYFGFVPLYLIVCFFLYLSVSGFWFYVREKIREEYYKSKGRNVHERD